MKILEKKFDKNENEKKEKPKNLWKINYNYQVKTVCIIDNYNIIELSNNFSIIYFKRTMLLFLLLIQLPN